MSKNNTSLAMPINELRGHAKTFFELSKNNLSVSTKAQHGIIAASLHDAYITILNRNDFWQDRTYMKYFFNEDDQSKRNYYILSKKARFTLQGIQNRVAWSINELDKTRSLQVEETKNKEHLEETYVIESDEENNQFKRPDGSLDKMLLTPFGRQYGTRIDSVITDIFLDEEDFTFDENAFLDKIYPLFQRYSDFDSISHESGGLIVYLGDIILHHDITLKLFAEKYLYNNKSELFARFYTSNKEKIEAFILDLLAAYFEEKFRSIFRIIKSTEMKKFACAFIIKRIYLFKGDGLTQFGYFMIKTVARYGGILTQS